MKAGLTVLLFLVLTFSLAASENVEITDQVKAAADKYVCEKFIITKAGVWQKIEYTQGVKRRYFKKDELGYESTIILELFANGKYQICTEYYKIYEQGDWQNLTSGKP